MTNNGIKHSSCEQLSKCGSDGHEQYGMVNHGGNSGCLCVCGRLLKPSMRTHVAADPSQTPLLPGRRRVGGDGDATSAPHVLGVASFGHQALEVVHGLGVAQSAHLLRSLVEGTLDVTRHVTGIPEGGICRHTGNM